ncbi:unnamed protein product [Didymodactylos carnosus]|uniref:c-SKI SMAD4-binding domain-containing protein n=1 Tax=Didymodactylos carnosus TaxID=1234261 RepID=A0A813P2Q4_9BILA|nr:unnamed protein product [Didymodactylos carnosus]CAF0746522.1 unnamed protein product [Didymodactylos carnosus]CAF3512042.1 unnamed protein product [Didymodactylos carnosus]CAF3525370.1 unnamed protein product [Didymodactylos carnosus]
MSDIIENDLTLSPISPVSPQSSRHDNSHVGTVIIRGVPIVSLINEGNERLCLAQISNDLLKSYSYNEIHNRRVALGITCVQCTPVQLELLRRAGAMPSSSRRCGMITRREAERLVNSFLEKTKQLSLPDNFVFEVYHQCGWGSRGLFIPIRYNSSRAKCIRCSFCDSFFSPNKFIFHSHRLPNLTYIQPDSPNFNAWRRHLKLHNPSNSEELHDAWEDVKAMFNGGNRKRTSSLASNSTHDNRSYQANSDNTAISKADDDEELIVPSKRLSTKLSTKEKRIHNELTVSSTTTDDYSEKRLELPPPPSLPPPPDMSLLLASSRIHSDPFRQFYSLPFENSTSSSLLHSHDIQNWWRFLKTPFFTSALIPSSHQATFRLPLPTKRSYEDLRSTTQIGGGLNSAFKPLLDLKQTEKMQKETNVKY